MPFYPRMQARRNGARLEAAIAANGGSTPGPTPEKWRALQTHLFGYIVLPGDPAYPADVRGNSLFPDLPAPQAIVYCQVEFDITLTLMFCNDEALPFAIRSGGHSTAGFSVSAGVVIDMSLMNGVHVDTVGKTATVQAGASLGKLNMTLKPYQLHVPGGECDTVGVAGHMQGGGYGFTSRMFGLNLDAVAEVRVMLADYSIVTANREQNSDLFWAIRGGTGGNFGVLLDIVYNLVVLPDVWGVCIKWSQSDAPAVLTVLQAKYMRTGGGPSPLGYQCAVAQVNGETSLMMMAMFNGSRADGMQMLQGVMTIGTPTILVDQVSDYYDLDSELLSWFVMPPDGTLEVKTCAYVARPLQMSDWATIIAYLATAPNPFNMFAMEIYGGAVSAIADDDCAFIHRQSDFDLFIDSFCNPNWSYNNEAEAKVWLEGFSNLLAQYSNGHRYQNYPDVTDVDYRDAYWGSAFNKLLAIKTAYDPHNVFRYAQSISAQSPSANGATGSTGEEIASAIVRGQIGNPTMPVR